MGYFEERVKELIKKANSGDSGANPELSEDIKKLALEMAVIIDDLIDAVDELDMRVIDLEAGGEHGETDG